MRFEEIYGKNNFKIFGDYISGEEIFQGSLGSCYLLSALIGLSRNQVLIRKLIITDKINSQGIYAVRFLIQGEYKVVTVDDYIPCNPNNHPAFSFAKKGEVWILLIEKAWAKINGSNYMKTWLGTPGESLTLLCEAPCLLEYHNRYTKNSLENVLWEKLKDYNIKNYIMCSDTEEVNEETGLVSFHAYSIIKIFEIKSLNLRLVLLRNPWGNKEWKGKYSKNCSSWRDNIIKIINEELSSSRFINDFTSFHKIKEGSFFMLFEDFISHFTWTFISKYDENYFYCHSKFVNQKYKEIINDEDYSIKQSIINQSKKISPHNELLKEFHSAYFELFTNTKCYICLHQPPKRVKQVNDESVYPFIGQIILAKRNFENNKFSYTYIASDFINWEKIYLDVNLIPGYYHLLFRTIDDFPDLVISTYAQTAIEIFKSENNLLNHWLRDIIISMPIKNSHRNYFDKKEKNSYCSHFLTENNKLGLGYFYYYNGSNEKNLKIEIMIEGEDKFKLLNYEYKEEPNKYFLTVLPMSDNLLYLEYRSLPWLTRLTWSHNLYFE